MKHFTFNFRWLLMGLLLCLGSSAWADPSVLFHETFGNNTGSARAWDDSYSVKTGVSAVYSGITNYTVSNAKQGKNTTGSIQSGLNQSTQGTDAYIVIGPLNVADYESLAVTYQWKAGSIKGTYSTKLEYATSSGGSYTEVSGTGSGATTFVERSYTLPTTAQVSTLYLKITWNTSNTQAIIDEVELTGTSAGGGSTLTDSDLALTGSTDLSFDLYNNASAKVINYTTSSTGAVTIEDNAYASFSVDQNNKTITVTPTAVTPTAQTITVNQAADDTYKAGSVTFTISVDDSTPIPTHTATFSVNGTTSTQDFEEGAVIVFPADPAAIEGKVFMGWVTTAITGTTNVAPTFVTSATMGDADVTYYAVFATVTPGAGTIKTDELTTSTFGSPTSYTNWSNKQATDGSDAVYAGNSRTDSSTFIQLRGSENSGIVTTTSGGKAKKVVVVWDSGTAADRTLDIYGKNTAYTASSQLYSTTEQGTLLGSIVFGTSTEVTISGDYEYIGIRSRANTLYLAKISIDWQSASDTYSDYCTTVAPDVTPSITINPTSIEMDAKGGDGELPVTVTCANLATDPQLTVMFCEANGTTETTYTWISATINEGKINGQAQANTTDDARTAYFKVRGKDANDNFVYSNLFTFTQKARSLSIKSDSNPWEVANSGDGHTFSIEYPGLANPTFEVVFYESNGTTAATYDHSWVTATITSGKKLDISVNSNNNDPARSAYLKVHDTESGLYSGLFTINQAAASTIVYSTIPTLFAAATGTAEDVTVNFNNWVVSGVSTNGKNVFVTDNNGNGFVIYSSSDMSSTYSAGSTLSGTTSCKLQLYNGFAELVNVNASDLSIKGSGAATVANIDMASLSGINTGAVVHYDNLTCSVSSGKYYLSDGTTTLQVYNSLYAFGSLEAGKQYNITGVYQQFNSTKEILPRSAADIEEVVTTTPSITVNPATVDATATGSNGTINVTYNNITTVVAEVKYYESDGTTETTYSWLIADIDASNNVEYVIDANDGAERTAYIKVYALDDAAQDVYSELITITQAAYAAPAKGTAENPYTVAEVIDGTATGTDVYVVGYIVGSYGSGSNKNFDRSGQIASNLAIAADPDEANVANTVAVQLPTGTIRDNFSTMDHPQYIGTVKILVKADITGYITTKGLKNTDAISAVSMLSTVSAAGWATLYTPYAFDFSGVAGLKAYTAKLEGSSVKLTQVQDVPANTGVVIEAAANTYELPVLGSSTTDQGDLTGDLIGATAFDAFSGYTLYILALNSAGDKVQFSPCISGSIAAGKAFLKVASGSTVKNLNVVFDGEDATGIEEVEGANDTVEGAIYDLQGRKVTNATRGLYIVNGKKVFIK